MSKPQPSWGTVAENYEEWYRTPRGRRYEAMEKELIAQLLGPAQGRRLLDIGCGTGHFTRWFHESGWEVWGLDIERRMLLRAQELSGEEVVYCRGDAEKLPFADESIQVCAMITTLESTSSPELALLEAFRVSREKIVLGILNSLSMLALWRRVRAMVRPTIFSRTRFYSAPALCTMIRRASRQLSIPVSIRVVSWKKLLFGRLPLGAFFAVAIELKK